MERDEKLKRGREGRREERARTRGKKGAEAGKGKWRKRRENPEPREKTRNGEKTG